MKYIITSEQKQEIENARRKNKNKRIEKRLMVLALRAEGKTQEEIVQKTGYRRSHVADLIKKYCTCGISEIIDNHYHGNRRNLSIEEEAELLDQFKKKAEQGQIIEVKEIKAAYEEKIGRCVGNGQIYNVLHRHGWRKIMPRSKHPKKANDEVIEASKKLKQKSRS